MTDLDRIEREVAIAAPAHHVWRLVSRPGWFINDGTIVDNQVEQQGDLSVVHHPVNGTFRFRTMALNPPRYAAFRWLSETEPESTLIEFWIDDAPDGVVLRVCESGFATLTMSEEERRRRLVENAEGWQLELAAARAFLESQLGPRVPGEQLAHQE